MIINNNKGMVTKKIDEKNNNPFYILFFSLIELIDTVSGMSVISSYVITESLVRLFT